MSAQLCWKIGEDTIINNMFAATGATTLKYSDENKYLSILRKYVEIGKHSRSSFEIISLSTIAYNMSDTTRGLDPWEEVFSYWARHGGTKIKLIEYPNFDNPKTPPIKVMFADKKITMKYVEEQTWWDLYDSLCYMRSTKDDRAEMLAAFAHANEEFAEYYNSEYSYNKN